MNTVTYCKHCGRALMWADLAFCWMHRKRELDALHEPEPAGAPGVKPHFVVPTPA